MMIMVMLVQARTCEELRQLGVSVSGQYWIDPDGAGRGAGPVRVHCDMRTGATRISHNLAGHHPEITPYTPPRFKLKCCLSVIQNCKEK